MAVGNVTFAGMASGLPADLVDKLLEAQKTRLKSYERDKTFFTNQQTAFGELETRMLALQTKAKELQDTTAWAPHTVSSSDEDQVTVTADSTAQPADHTIHVTQLATYNTAVMDTGVATSATLLGAGTFTFEYDGSTQNNLDGNAPPYQYSVAIGATDTINDLAASINALDFGSTASGLSASVLNDGSTYRLVLTAKDGGTVYPGGTKRITNVSALGGSNFTVSTPTNAQLTIDGVAVSSPTNQVSDALTGVTLNLKQLTGAAGVTVSIQNDKSALKTTLNSFVDSFNEVIDYVNQHKTDTLSGESLARSVISQMRNVLNTQTQTAANTPLTPFSTL
ncbi:flagellar filament capping protein FliD, partial [Candidatus Magnetominusculus xianensis]|uniref:flagellar filament capping protein FliD n=1 Tax=Candidatus Magnetominusculus xianensis TaxID=1748249 RepID=UPI0012EEB320